MMQSSPRSTTNWPPVFDVITDGEQTRYDFNLSFYGRLEGIDATPHFAAPFRAAGSRSAG